MLLDLEDRENRGREGYGNLIFFISKTLAYLPGAMQGLSISSKVQKSQQKVFIVMMDFSFKAESIAQFSFIIAVHVIVWVTEFQYHRLSSICNRLSSRANNVKSNSNLTEEIQ